jgi:toxin ParE1/3/4
MARIIVSREARKDILAIRQYICEELSNPSASQRIVNELKKSIRGLESFPERGRPLDALISVQTEYRYLVCENYCIFYLSSGKEVLIVRILHQRQDCLRALFLLH